MSPNFPITQAANGVIGGSSIVIPPTPLDTVQGSTTPVTQQMLQNDALKKNAPIQGTTPMLKGTNTPLTKDFLQKNAPKNPVQLRTGNGVSGAGTTLPSPSTVDSSQIPPSPLENPFSIPKASAQEPQVQPGEYAIHPGQDPSFTKLIESGRQSNTLNQAMLDTIMAGNPNAQFVRFAKNQMSTLPGSPEENAKQVLNFFAYGDPNHPDPLVPPAGFADHITQNPLSQAIDTLSSKGQADKYMGNAGDALGRLINFKPDPNSLLDPMAQWSNQAIDSGLQAGANTIRAIAAPIAAPIENGIGWLLKNNPLSGAGTPDPAFPYLKGGGPSLIDAAQKYAPDQMKTLTDVTGAIGDVAIAKGVINAPSQLIDKFYPSQTPEDIKNLVGKIVQAKDATSLAKGEQALRVVDTRGVQTYQDLFDTLDEKGKIIRSIQNDLLDQVPGTTPLEDFSKEVTGAKGSTMTVNPVQKAIADLQDFYSSTGDPESYVKITDLAKKAADEGLTAREVNDIAREYGNEFGSKAFNKMGDPLTSVSAQSFENTRMGVKEAARSLMPNDASKILDKEMSSLMDTKLNVKKMMETVQGFSNKAETVGFMNKAASLVGKGINMATFDGLKGFLEEIFPKTIGAGTLNPSEIEDALSSNLSRFQKLIKNLPDLEDAQAAAAINRFVTEEHTGPLLKQQMNASNAASVGMSAPEAQGMPMQGGNNPLPNTIPVSSLPVNSDEMPLTGEGGVSPNDPGISQAAQDQSILDKGGSMDQTSALGKKTKIPRIKK